MRKRQQEFPAGQTSAAVERADALIGKRQFSAALMEIQQSLDAAPQNNELRFRKADILGRLGDAHASVALLQEIANQHSDSPPAWLNLAHGLRALGNSGEAIVAYRKAIACRSGFGAAWWGLANIKGFGFPVEEIAAMEGLLANPALAPEDRTPLQFAFAKAMEQQKCYPRAFEHYAKANAALRTRRKYDAEQFSAMVEQSKGLFTSEFFAERAGCGCKKSDPIFVVSLPRSGSTLIEQILASHSAIEGAGELEELPALVRNLQSSAGSSSRPYPGLVSDLPYEALAELGEAYLQSVHPWRKLQRPFFVDKKPSNFRHIGLIRLTLPKARIIEVRRHPAASSLSAYRHYFESARPSLTEFGRFYRDYISLFAHWDRVLPNQIHTVVYEELIRNPEREIRKLLTYLALPFEDSCMAFHESGRAVFTPSAEQVRQPLYSHALDEWRNYEPWLSPLFNSLGSALNAYPDVPEELR